MASRAANAAPPPPLVHRPPPPPDSWDAWAHTAIARADLAPLDQVEELGAAPAEPGRASETEVVHALVDARVSHRVGNYVRSRELLERAKTLLATIARPGLWLTEWLELWLAHDAYARGTFTDASRRYARALSAFERSGDIRGASAAVRGLGNVAKYLGLYAQASEHYDRAIELARACGDAVGLAAAAHNHGNVHMALGDFRRASAAFRGAIRAFDRAGRPDLSRHAMMGLACAHHELGQHQRALELLDRAAPPASIHPIHAGDEAERLIAVATAQAGLRRRAAALDTLARAARLARASGESHTEALAHRATADLLLAVDPAGALAAARRGIRATAAAKAPTEITAELHGLAARASERCKAWRSAAQHFEKAFETQRRFATQRNRDRADSLALHRELAQARHHAELARLENARLSEALAEIAARLDSEKSGRPGRDPEDVTPESLRGLGLRPRESEVLLWLIRGKSNVEIGTILGCSAETVKSHLKRIYGQLDVTNRTAAAASALARITI